MSDFYYDDAHDVQRRLERIERKLDQMAVTQAQLDTDLQTLSEGITTTIAALEGAVAAALEKAAGGVDFSAEDAEIKASIAALSAAAASVASAQPAPAPATTATGTAGTGTTATTEPPATPLGGTQASTPATTPITA